MHLPRVVLLALIGGVVAGSLAAQIPTRRRTDQQVAASLPRLLVANPHSFALPDSAASAQIGNALRLRMEKVSNGTYFVIPRQQMNDALRQFGYPDDAILPLMVQRTFATSMQARVLMSSILTRVEGGRYAVSARLAGFNDDAGNVVALTQGAGQTAETFGNALADGFQAAVKTAADAKACVDQQATARDKAVAAAKKALAVMPSNGLAHFCLARIAFSKNTHADSAEATKALQAAVAGDPLSLPAWTLLAGRYENAGDTTRTVDALKQMLLIAPTNEPLREQAFKLFLKYERPEAAQQAAEEGLKLDPTNADLWDLLSNACVYRSNFKCAVDALEQVVANDSTKADSAYFLKITVMAGQEPDTVRLLKWARRGVKKYPHHLDLLGQLLKAYSLTGQIDSTVAVTARILQLDTTAVVPALAAAQALQAAKRLKDARPFLDFATKHGDAQAKQAVAGIILNGALPLLQPPQDFEGAAVLLREVVGLADPAGRVAPIANYFLGLSLLQQIPKLDPEAERQKSCELATKEQGLAHEAETAFKASGSYKPDDVVKFQKYLDGLKPRVASMLKVYCK